MDSTTPRIATPASCDGSRTVREALLELARWDIGEADHPRALGTGSSGRAYAWERSRDRPHPGHGPHGLIDASHMALGERQDVLPGRTRAALEDEHVERVHSARHDVHLVGHAAGSQRSPEPARVVEHGIDGAAQDVEGRQRAAGFRSTPRVGQWYRDRRCRMRRPRSRSRR